MTCRKAGNRAKQSPRLSRWHWSRDWAEKTFKEYLDHAKNEFEKLAKEKNKRTGGPVDVLKKAHSWNEET
jgi:hypothetical protein